MLNATQLKEYAQLTQATYAYFSSSQYLNRQALKNQIMNLSGSEGLGANFTAPSRSTKGTGVDFFSLN